MIAAAAGYLLIQLRHRPAGVSWAAPPVAAVVASALALQAILFRLMRFLR